MLFLKLKNRSAINIGDHICIFIRRASGSEVTLGIHAPEALRINRHGPFTEEQFDAKLETFAALNRPHPPRPD